MWRFLTYLRLKATVTFIRLTLRLRRPGGWRGAAIPVSPRARVLRIPSRDAGRSIKAHVYQSSHSASSSSSLSSPVLINFHGSGFVLPMHGSDDLYCSLVAARTPYTVLDVQYRLAPEHPFPAALHDAEDVVSFVHAQSSSSSSSSTAYDDDDDDDDDSSSRIAVSGFSAGANLALVLAGAGVCSPGTFSACVAFYPPTDLSIEPGAKRAPDESGQPIPPGVARLFDECYFGQAGVSPRDPRVSPALAGVEGWRGTGTVVVLTGARDSLAPEAEGLAGRIEEGVQGTRVVRRRFEGCGHAWDKRTVPGSREEAARDEAYGLVVDVLNGR